MSGILDGVDIAPGGLGYLALVIPATRVNDIVNDRRGATAETALRLARYFGDSAEFGLNLQAAHDLRAAEREVAARIEREILPRVAA